MSQSASTLKLRGHFAATGETGEIVPRLRSFSATTALTWYRDCGHLVQQLQSPTRSRLPVVITVPGISLPRMSPLPRISTLAALSNMNSMTAAILRSLLLRTSSHGWFGAWTSDSATAAILRSLLSRTSSHVSHVSQSSCSLLLRCRAPCSRIIRKSTYWKMGAIVHQRLALRLWHKPLFKLHRFLREA